MLRVIIQTIIVILLCLITYMIPSAYDISRFTKVYDLFEIVGKEFKITNPQNITSLYFPTPNIQSFTNVTYYIDPVSNIIKLKINNIDYQYSLEDINTKKIVIPIIIGAR